MDGNRDAGHVATGGLAGITSRPGHPVRGTAGSGHSRIAYELRGARRWRWSWLVLIQRLGFDRHGWEPVLRNLGRHFRLVLVDNRGSGPSDLLPGSFGVA